MLGQKGIELKLGQKIHYKSKSMQHPEATYEGEVIGVYKHFYEILGKPIKSTMHEKNTDFFGEVKPYKFCINKYLDVDMERVYIVAEGKLSEAHDDEEREARAG